MCICGRAACITAVAFSFASSAIAARVLTNFGAISKSQSFPEGVIPATPTFAATAWDAFRAVTTDRFSVKLAVDNSQESWIYLAHCYPTSLYAACGFVEAGLGIGIRHFGLFVVFVIGERWRAACPPERPSLYQVHIQLIGPRFNTDGRRPVTADFAKTDDGINRGLTRRGIEQANKAHVLTDFDIWVDLSKGTARRGLRSRQSAGAIPAVELLGRCEDQTSTGHILARGLRSLRLVCLFEGKAYLSVGLR